MTQRSRHFSPRQLLATLSTFPATGRYWVAYSGGPDSLALLHALAALQSEMPAVDVRAVHVNHGLLPIARQWQTHCADVCSRLRVGLETVEVEVGGRRGESIEAAARTARYRALSRLMDTGDTVLTAHTQEDQAETLLLQLLRGAGADGLAGMPEIAVFANGWLGRPLLRTPRALVHDYAASLSVESVEDPSNQDRRLARNYLRHEVLPSILSRWPSAGNTLARAASHLAESSRLTKDLAGIDLERVCEPGSNTLNVTVLRSLGDARGRNVLRAWIRGSGTKLPSSAQLERLEVDVVGSGWSRNPVLAWSDMSVRRYGDTLYLVPRDINTNLSGSFEWDLERSLSLCAGRLVANRRRGEGIAASQIRGNRVVVQFRRGGERCRPAGSAHHSSLKHLFQQYRIPPWERGYIPLIYIENKLAAVVGLWVCETFAAGMEEDGWVLDWDDARSQ